jgi:glucosamine-phosphate N-acetyltransferase
MTASDPTTTTTNLLLFPANLISPAAASSFPEGYTIRPLARDDYHRGFFQCLQTLTWTGDISEERFLKQFDMMKTSGQGWYYCVVIVNNATDRIAGTGAMAVERKLYVLNRSQQKLIDPT